jgi:membrane protein YqaA with SNARE-associated domain
MRTVFILGVTVGAVAGYQVGYGVRSIKAYLEIRRLKKNLKKAINKAGDYPVQQAPSSAVA